MQVRYIVPLLAFLIITAILYRGLHLHPNEIPSPLIGKSAPQFELPTLDNKQVNNTIFYNKVTLLNVWATWCYACAIEHEFLMKIAKEPGINLIGLDYKDDPERARNLLSEQGNPYQLVAIDKEGQVAIDWGVYGTPETFVIDKKGILRYKHVGIINEENWEQIFKPLILRLQAEIA